MEKEMESGMRKVWLVADSVVSPLGMTSRDNYNNIISGVSGIKQEEKRGIWVSQFSTLKVLKGLTRFESMAIMALNVLKRQATWSAERTLFVLSSTKGNIEVLENDQTNHSRIHLHAVASLLAKEAGIADRIVVSNACISGVAAILAAKRYIESGSFDHAVVLGADTVNNFVISGFKSLNALSNEICKPFDAFRSGINLGEAASAVLLTAKPEEFETKNKVAILGGAISNDANHISGPSKTGEELAVAISKAFDEAKVKAEEIDFISAHGTATLFNDEMEAKAFNLTKLSDTPLHSLKGNFGHTLGTAGIMETVMSAHSLYHQELIPSYGFDKIGVTQPVNVIKKRKSKSMRIALKTASGFGGCNAALVMGI
jgi:3-oxoacyl-[acyl-carrier-protein] synthase-1